MVEIGFYHLTKMPLEQGLGRLLEKVLESGKSAVVRFASEDRLDFFDRALWTYRKDSFLPHAGPYGGHSAKQPIYLTTGTEVPNKGQILILIDGAATDGLENFERCLELFDGNDATSVGNARERWKWADSNGYDRVYWQQDERGAWRRS